MDVGAPALNISTAPPLMGSKVGYTGEQFGFRIQLRVDLHTDGQFPCLSGSLLALLALFLLGLEGLGFLLELLAEGDTVRRGRLEAAVCEGGEMQVMWTNQWALDVPIE